MVAEVVEWLRPRPGARLVDATVGLGGHAAALLAAAPGTSLLGLDRDPHALQIARERLQEFGERVALRQGNFAALPSVLEQVGWGPVDGILLDLGVSSLQLDDLGRGFSFRSPGSLDMRMDPGASTSAADVVNRWAEQDLARLIAEYGEERRARRVARAIVRARPLETTAELAETVARALAPRGDERLHPATRTFQAIRIAVNEEIGALDRMLADGWTLLRPGGRLAVLAYHSLEDRPVKMALRRWAADCLCPAGTPRCACGWTRKVRLLTRRPLRPSPAEVARNPRARSARLRVAERVGTEAE
jgi:16S rRNA (cytosine1402-N4)-methyltransferase